MGLDYSYRLYFPKHLTWTALQAVVDMAEPQTPLTRIIFPDRELLIPLQTWSRNNHMLQYDAAELDFMISVYFDEDEALLDYLHGRGDEPILRSPPGSEHENQISIGYIYLTVYQERPSLPASDVVCFNFGTTGTRMSLLFDGSVSIRKTFVGVLERVPGVCGVFNREIEATLFWWKGQPCSVEIGDPYLLPEEIEVELKRR